MIWKTLGSPTLEESDEAHHKKESNEEKRRPLSESGDELEGKVKDAPELKGKKDYSLDLFADDKERQKLLNPEVGDRYAPAELNKDHYNPNSNLNDSYNSNPGQMYSAKHAGHDHDHDDLLERLGVGGYKSNQYHS